MPSRPSRSGNRCRCLKMIARVPASSACGSRVQMMNTQQELAATASMTFSSFWCRSPKNAHE
eukprot:516390-Amphidinium_carterae.1